MKTAIRALSAASVPMLALALALVSAPCPAPAQSIPNALDNRAGFSPSEILSRQRSFQAGQLARPRIEIRPRTDGAIGGPLNQRGAQVIERYRQRQACLKAHAATKGLAICRLVRD